MGIGLVVPMDDGVGVDVHRQGDGVGVGADDADAGELVGGAFVGVPVPALQVRDQVGEGRATGGSGGALDEGVVDVGEEADAGSVVDVEAGIAGGV